MLESIPQTHILLCLAGQNPTLIIGKNSTQFWFTFATSFMSATFALSKFLKTGPCRLVSDVGRLGGFFERGFICLLVNITLTILIKGANLTIGLLGDFGTNKQKTQDKWISIYWILLNILPQLIYVGSFYTFYLIYYIHIFSSIIIFIYLKIFFFLGYDGTSFSHRIKKNLPTYYTVSRNSLYFNVFLVDNWACQQIRIKRLLPIIQTGKARDICEIYMDQLHIKYGIFSCNKLVIGI